MREAGRGGGRGLGLRSYSLGLSDLQDFWAIFLLSTSGSRLVIQELPYQPLKGHYVTKPLEALGFPGWGT